MATAGYIFCRFSDGTYAYLGNTDITTGAAGEEVTTIGSPLNQVSGVSLGQAFVGKTLTHAVAMVSTAGSGAASLLWASLKSPNGNYIIPIQGGAQHFGEMPALVRPVKMEVGLTAWVAWQASGDSGTKLASFIGYTADGYCDVLTATGVSGSEVELQNATGTTFGQSFAGKTIVCSYSTYGGSLGINDVGAGASALYAFSADGNLKGLFPCSNVGSDASDSIVPLYKIPVRVSQNDTLNITTDDA
jgi:hypothetical protein